MKKRTDLQLAAKRVWESLLQAHGHLTDLRNLDGGNEPFIAVDRRLSYVFEQLADFMHEDDCDE